MENSQLKDLQEEVSEATKQYILTTFNSENGMKTYYLQMSNIIRSAHINPPIDTEYNSLKKLSKKLKQYCRLSCNSWGIKFSQFPSCIYLC